MRCDTFMLLNGGGSYYTGHDPWFEDREKTRMPNRNDTGRIKFESDAAIEGFVGLAIACEGVFNPPGEDPDWTDVIIQNFRSHG